MAAGGCGGMGGEEVAMGYIKHDAIIITSWNDEAINQAARTAHDLGLRTIGPSDEAFNGYRTLLVCPDGSKEGWTESDEGDEKRAKFVTYLNSIRHADNSSPLEWVAVSYGGDDWGAKIVAHAWQVPLKDE